MGLKKKAEKKNNFTLGIYVVYDKISEQIRTITLAENDRSAVSNIVLSGIGNRFPYRDMEIRAVGYIESYTCKHKSYGTYQVIPWNIYSVPISERENLKALGDDVVKAYDECMNDAKKVENIEEVDKNTSNDRNNEQKGNTENTTE